MKEAIEYFGGGYVVITFKRIIKTTMRARLVLLDNGNAVWTANTNSIFNGNTVWTDKYNVVKRLFEHEYPEYFDSQGALAQLPRTPF